MFRFAYAGSRWLAGDRMISERGNVMKKETRKEKPAEKTDEKKQEAAQLPEEELDKVTGGSECLYLMSDRKPAVAKKLETK